MKWLVLIMTYNNGQIVDVERMSAATEEECVDTAQAIRLDMVETYLDTKGQVYITADCIGGSK